MIKRLYYIILQRLFVLRKKKVEPQGKVYMFHNVNEDDDTYSISKEHFSEFIDYLTDNNRVVDIDTLIKERSDRNVVITFDDVYESVYQNAYPLLREKELTYYLFICNEFIGKDNYLNREQIEEMILESNCIIGSHGKRHYLSRFVDIDEFKKDLNESKKELEDSFGINVNVFAFPYGSMYACSKRNIKKAGAIFDNICMTYALPYNSDFGKLIPRININDKTYKGEMQ